MPRRICPNLPKCIKRVLKASLVRPHNSFIKTPWFQVLCPDRSDFYLRHPGSTLSVDQPTSDRGVKSAIMHSLQGFAVVILATLMVVRVKSWEACSFYRDNFCNQYLDVGLIVCCGPDGGGTYASCENRNNYGFRWKIRSCAPGYECVMHPNDPTTGRCWPWPQPCPDNNFQGC